MNVQNPSLEHQNLVRAAINTFSSQGYKILEAANIEGYPSPQRHETYEPDIVMRDSRGLLHLVEAKTGDDLFSQRTKQQILEFSNRVMPFTSTPSLLSGQAVPLHILVYQKDVADLTVLLRSLGLQQLVGTRIFIHWLE